MHEWTQNCCNFTYTICYAILKKHSTQTDENSKCKASYPDDIILLVGFKNNKKGLIMIEVFNYYDIFITYISILESLQLGKNYLR